MTPKERVKMALAHKEADRVPTGEFATDYRIVEQVLGRETFWRGKTKMIQALWDGRRDEVVESQKKDIVEFTLKLGLDMVPVNLVYSKDLEVEKPRKIDHETWEDSQGNILRYSALTEDIIILKRGDKPAPPPKKSSKPVQPGPYVPDESEMELVNYVIEKLGDTHFIFARPGGKPGVGYGYTQNYEAQYIRIIEDPEGVLRSGMSGAESLAHYIKPFIEAGVDGFAIGQDYGFNSGPFMSPKHFAELYYPPMKRQCEIIHEYGLPVLWHSCGNNRLILDKMIESGMDAYQAIQPVEKIDEIKQLYGDKITLWGGVSTDSLCRDTSEDIRQQTLFSLKHCAKNGGFILGSSHSLTVGTKYDNYMAMLDTLREYGNYPIDIKEDIPEPNWAMA